MQSLVPIDTFFYTLDCLLIEEQDVELRGRLPAKARNSRDSPKVIFFIWTAFYKFINFLLPLIVGVLSKVHQSARSVASFPVTIVAKRFP